MIDQKPVLSSVIDPVCGMIVNPSSAAGQYQYQGTTYYFCSRGCAEKFRAAPARYLKLSQFAPLSNGVVASEIAVEYTCPMHPEVRQMGPGSCPKCGMALEFAVTPPAAKKIEYTCPMHPQIVRSEPGLCPICGMALEPREVTAEEVNPELVNMTRRFWISLALTIPTLLLMVSSFIPNDPLKHLLGSGRPFGWSLRLQLLSCSGAAGPSFSAVGCRL